MVRCSKSGHDLLLHSGEQRRMEMDSLVVVYQGLRHRDNSNSIITSIIVITIFATVINDVTVIMIVFVTGTMNICLFSVNISPSC